MVRRPLKRKGADSKRGWVNRTVLGIGLASLFSDLGHETVTSVLPAYLASMGAAAGALGTVEGFADGLSCIAKLYGGWLADQWRRRKPLCVAGYSAMTLSPVMIAAAVSWPLVAAGRALARVSRGIRTSARKVLLTEAVSGENYGKAFGLERAMDTCGAIVAPVAVIVMLRMGWSHRNLILLSALPALAAALAVAFLVRETPKTKSTTRPFWGSFKGFQLEFKEFLAAVGIFGLGDFADSFYILYAVQALSPRLGMPIAATWSVALYAVHNVVYAALAYVGGWLSDYLPKRWLLTLGYLLTASAALCMAVGIQSLTGLVIIFILGGSGVGLYEAVEDALAANLLPVERRGRGFGALALTTGLGDWLSSLGIGWAWAIWGPQTAFAWAAGVMLVGTAWMVRLQARQLRHA